MSKTKIKDTIIKVIQAFNDINNKCLMSVLWVLVAIMIAMAAYGGVVRNQNLIIQAGLLIPIGSFAAFGTKAIYFSDKKHSAEVFIHGMVFYTIWVVSFGIMLSIVPFIGHEIEKRLLEDNKILASEDIDIYPLFGRVYEIFAIYLFSAYIVQFIGTQLKDYGTTRPAD